MSLRFRSFRSRLVVVFLGLFALIQATGYVAVSAFVRASARHTVEDELRLASTLFARQLDVRTQQLVSATRLLSGDFALKTAVATSDHATTASVLDNHRQRVDADVLMLATLDGQIVADTQDPARRGTPFPAPRLLAEAEAGRDASGVVAVGPKLYQLTVVPVLAPEPIAWLAAGFAIDDQIAADLRRLSGLHVSFVAGRDAALTVHASTLGAADRAALTRGLQAARASGVLGLDGGEHLVRVQPVDRDAVVVLQRPLAEALAPYDRMLLVLLAVAAAGVVLALLGAVLVARRVSRPVLTLARGARRVAAGDFDVAVQVRQRDELGELAGTFNEMVAGLRERERVRDELERTAKLKRFFSPQLADALSSGDDSVLASHRRLVTVVFCDLRGFTAFADTADPEDVMRLLRDYHAAIGPLVFAQEGTLERFTGDGLMVFFNDPVPCPDPAARAVRMTVAMRDAVAALLASWRRRGYALGFGTGIAMGEATLGRIGFEGRFDYAAIGSVTNLSARLCQEARDGQILVSAAVHAEVETLVEAQPIGSLALRGFARPVEVFDILGLRVAPAAPAVTGAAP
ncbi:MAG TPA: adenylate/guanylate cyclase domain-containing protein [Methylomirabilota bacterium]|nr:adenylate/guanylate cyclase domain-containing protein [Methylomirabilota bacterium]